MITEAYVTQGIVKGTVGQYMSVKKAFVSTTNLTGEVIRFNPGVYTDLKQDDLPVAFQIVYPPSTGQTEMTKLNCQNHKAFINVLDAKNFEIEYRFFASKDFGGWFPLNSYTNASAFDSGAIFGRLGFYIRIGISKPTEGNYVIASFGVQIAGFCENPISIDDDGYIPGQDLDISISMDGTVSNNFYVGMIKSDAISNSGDIVPGLVMNYAKIGGAVSGVEDLPYYCIKSGVGFMQMGNESYASVTIDGTCLQSGSTYKVYIVYFQEGKWRSCISRGINQTSQKAAIIPDVTLSVTDNFGNSTALGCVKGLAKGTEFECCVTIDVADYDAKLAEAGYTGTFTDYLENVKAFSGTAISSTSGLPLVMTNTHPEYCVSGFSTDKANAFVIIQFTMNFPGYKDIINVPFELVFDAVETSVTVPVSDANGVVGEMCEGETYTLAEDYTDCLILESIEGGEYTESDIVTGDSIDLTEIPLDSEVCLKVICDSTPVTTPDCECPECPEARIEISIDTCGFSPGTIQILINGVTVDSGNAKVSYIGLNYSVDVPLTGNTTDDSLVFDENHTTHNFYVDVTMTDENGCQYLFYSPAIITTHDPADCGQTIEGTMTKVTPNQPDCDCPEEETECLNYAAIDYVCDPENELITVEVVKNITSPVDEETFEYSTDGGLTFQECTGEISYSGSVFVVYECTFTDDCEKLHIEQVIECAPEVECANIREIELDIVSNELTITITDTFESDILSDKLFVSLDGGVTYTQYDPDEYVPLEVEGDENIIVYTETIFDDQCSDLIVTETLDLTSEENEDECDGYAGYTLTVTHDEETGEITVTKAGNEADLVVNELLWTLDGSNPFDQNGSGMPYTTPVIGYGLFIARWKIKKVFCEELILDAVVWVKECVTLCDPVEVRMVRFYEKWTTTAALEDEFLVTVITVPDKSIVSAVDINADYDVSRNGVKMIFVNTNDPSTLGMYEYTFDLATNKILISTTITVYEGENIELIYK